ncbi:MAG: T9SS type A sorting domain-containing protein [Bacteroidota bacterium]
MMQSGTKHLGWLAALALVFAAAAPQHAQGQVSLDDEFIFFVDGSNVNVPGTIDGNVVDDPLNPGDGNKVIEFGNANFSERGWRWDAATGADATGMVGEGPVQGQTLYIRVLSDPANAFHDAGFGQHSAMRIQFTDSQENDGDLENGNPAFRVSWVFPEWVHDGEWHELAIPLPPTTIAAMDSLRLDKNVDGSPLAAPVDSLAKMWWYNGAWTGSGGITPPGVSLYGGTNPEFFQEFSWDAVKQFGIAFDWDSAGDTGAPVYFDYFYIGDSETSIQGLSDAPPALSAITTSVEDGSFKVSWEHPGAEYSGYQAYVSDQPITDLDGPLVLSLGTFNAIGEGAGTMFEATYDYLAPHPSLAGEVTLHFAVAPTNAFGVRNNDVSGSQSTASGSTLAKPHLFELTEEDVDAIFDNLDAGTVDGGPLVGTFEPFQINGGRYREGGGGPPEIYRPESDLSARLWAGFMPEFEEVYIYAEVMDDTLSAIPEGSGAGDAWRYDSIEINWGMYAPQSLLVNSTHGAASTGSEGNRGAEPDYQVRIAPESALGNPSELVNAGVLSETFSGVGDITAGAAVAGPMEENGEVVGWNILAFVPWTVLRDAGGDELFAGNGFPTGDEIELGLMNILFNDNDDPGTNNRTAQGLWTDIPGSDGSSWQNPTQWEIVAFAGADVAYDRSQVFVPQPGDPNAGGVNINDPDELPEGYALEQNYPNPFNPTTTLAFSIPQAQDVSLTVYNVLGQQVATLVNNQLLTAGRHEVAFNATELSSGVYVYRLDAGAYSLTKSMLLIK